MLIKKQKNNNKIIFLFIILVIAVVAAITTAFIFIKNGNTSLTTILLIVLAVLFAFSAGIVWNHIHPTHQGGYKLVKSAEYEKEQAELKTAIMLSQIQPHFLYNALNAIKVLCKNDPEEAAYAIEEFADYLRMNMSSLQSKKLVPFSEELQHTRTYLRIEKLRFQEKLNVVYDIRFEDFTIPPLSLQPLVENAVKHGVGQIENGGTVTIRTRKDGKKAIISVEDNGMGFDPNAIFDDGRSHVGIENVKTRLSSMNAGFLTIDSAPGKGTTASIILELDR